MARIVEPLFFERVWKEKIWGGRRLASLFDWSLPEEKRIGESWELSDVSGEESRIRGGHFAGRSLRDLMEHSGREILGHAEPAPGGRFPLLVKFLDTDALLSVQVHPDDETAKRHNEPGWGKTEAWYFLEADEGKALTVGLKEGVRAEALREGIRKATLESLLETVEVKPGEAVLIPAGLVHALGPGFTLVEIQQTSDITYRLYDWNRKGDDGKPRTLHVEKGVESVNFALGRPPVCRPRWRKPTPGFREGQLISCDHFRISVGEVEEAVCLRTPGRAVAVVATQGQGEIGWGAQYKAPLDPGDVALIPASLDRYELRASEQKKFTFLLVEPGPWVRS